MAEKSNPNFPTLTNVLFEGAHTCQFYAHGMPMLTSVGQRNRWENDLELGDVKFIQRHSRSTLEVAFLIDKLCLKVFSGYANADACKFLDEFHLFCVFHDMNSSDPRKIAVFHLHVQGPALVLFGQLLEEKRVKWRSVQSELRNTYLSISLLDPTLTLESAMFNSLTLTLKSTSRWLLWYYSRKRQEFGQAGTGPHEQICWRVAPSATYYVAFCVQAERCTTFAETLTASKTGKAFGYRQIQPFAAAIRASDPIMNVVLKELSRLSMAVQQ